MIKKIYFFKRYGFDKLRALTTEIQWAKKHGYDTRPLEIKKRVLEKKLINQFREFSGQKKEQEVIRRVSISKQQSKLKKERLFAGLQVQDMIDDMVGVI